MFCDQIVINKRTPIGANLKKKITDPVIFFNSTFNSKTAKLRMDDVLQIKERKMGII